MQNDNTRNTIAFAVIAMSLVWIIPALARAAH